MFKSNQILSRKEVATRLGVSLRTLDRTENLPKDFPKKVRITSRRVGYRESDIIRWMAGETHTE